MRATLSTTYLYPAIPVYVRNTGARELRERWSSNKDGTTTWEVAR
jgi:hypothetical protein